MRPASRLRRTLPWLVALAAPAAPAAAQPDPLGPPPAEVARFAGAASRDCRMFVWIQDRAAFLRRAAATDVAAAAAGTDRVDFVARLEERAAAASLFLPQGMIASAGVLLGRGRGGLAVSVEGFVLDAQKRPEPDLLVVAEKSGFEGLVAALRGAGEAGAGAALLETLPSELAPAPGVPVRTVFHRGSVLVEFTPASGPRLVLCETRDFLIGARSVHRVQAALDRLTSPAIGTLADDARFREVTATLQPRPGSLFAFVDLRSLRLEKAFLPARSQTALELLAGRLARFDALGVVGRGVGDAFEARAYLARGSSLTGEDSPLLARNRPFRFAGFLPGDVTFALALRLSLRQAVGLATAAQVAFGLYPLPADGGRVQDAIGGAAALDELGRALGDEVVLFQPGGARVGETHPRLGILCEVRDPAAAERWLSSRATGAASPLRVIPVKGRTLYELQLRGPGPSMRMALTLADGFLVAMPNALLLREFLAGVDSGRPRLAQTGTFLAPHDRLDRDPDEPASALLHAATPDLARSAVAWMPMLLLQHWPEWDDEAPEAPEALFLADLAHVLDDPDVQEALDGLVIRARAVEGGVLLEAAGP